MLLGGTVVENLRPLEHEEVLKGTMQFCGVFCHVFFIRVEYVPVLGGMAQRPVKDPLGRFEDLMRFDESIAVFLTLSIPGYAGDWVVYVHPGER